MRQRILLLFLQQEKAFREVLEGVSFILFCFVFLQKSQYETVWFLSSLFSSQGNYLTAQSKSQGATGKVQCFLMLSFYRTVSRRLACQVTEFTSAESPIRELKQGLKSYSFSSLLVGCDAIAAEININLIPVPLY